MFILSCESPALIDKSNWSIHRIVGTGDMIEDFTKPIEELKTETEVTLEDDEAVFILTKLSGSHSIANRVSSKEEIESIINNF